MVQGPVRGLLLAVGLVTVTTRTAYALLRPASALPSVHSARTAATTSTKYSQIATWRGGASDVGSGGVQPPVMNAQLALVRVAGYGIIAGSLCLKTPQIARVWKAKSLVGLAPASIYADVFLFATSVIYHILKRNPIRAYGESVVVLVQTMIMVGLLWRFGVNGIDDENGSTFVSAGSAGKTKQNNRKWLSFLGGAGRGEGNVRKISPPGGGPLGRTAIVLGSIAASLACFQYLPERLWGLLVIVSTPTIFAVQLPQITKNFRQKHTGELALLTVLLSFVGSSIRIGTTIADLGGDPWLLFNYVLGATTNALMLSQIYIYRVRTAEVRRKVAEVANKQRASAAA